MKLGANGGDGLVAVSATALLTGCGAVTAMPTPNQPTVGTSGGAPTSAESAPAPTPAETESNPPGDIPDNQMYVPFTPPGGRVSVKVPEGWARSGTGTNLGKVTTERRSGSTVVVVRYQGDSPQDPVTTGKVVRDAFERYVYYHNGQRLDLTLSGPTNADNVDPWRIVSDSVRWQ
jgi:hypothetical protein